MNESRSLNVDPNNPLRFQIQITEPPLFWRVKSWKKCFWKLVGRNCHYLASLHGDLFGEGEFAWPFSKEPATRCTWKVARGLTPMNPPKNTSFWRRKPRKPWFLSFFFFKLGEWTTTRVTFFFFRNFQSTIHLRIRKTKQQILRFHWFHVITDSATLSPSPFAMARYSLQILQMPGGPNW